MEKEKIKRVKHIRRKKKIRTKITGTNARPRLSVFKSNADMFLQLIDDQIGVTLISASSKEIKKKDIKDSPEKGKKTAVSYELGKLIAKKAKDKKITEVVFDRGGNKYHGRVKAAADGAREGGLIL